MKENKADIEQNGRQIVQKDILPRQEFFYRVLIFAGVITVFGLLLILLWESTQVVLLIFAGLLLAVFLDGSAALVRRYVNVSKNWSLTIILILIIGISALFFLLFFSSLKEQFFILSQQLPTAVDWMQTRLEQYAVGSWLLEKMPPPPLSLGNQSSNVFGRITGFFSSFLGVVVNISIILMTAVYFAFNPDLYYRGAVKLFPKSKQKRVQEVFNALGFTLRQWFLGRITVMIINGTLTALGLWFLGVPLAFALGVITALLNFIPNIGPFLAAVPAILIAFTISPMTALYTAILYLIVQNLEGFVFTPLVQQQAVSLPPVLIIAAQLLLGILFGFMGVLLAVPIVAVFFVLVKMLYVEDLLGNEVEVEGEEKIAENPE